MEIYKQVINDVDLVSITSFKDLRLEFWKDYNKDELEKEIDEDAKFKLKVLKLLPDFDNLITIYEIKWNKSRKDFNIIEVDFIKNEFKKLYGRKINATMGEK